MDDNSEDTIIAVGYLLVTVYWAGVISATLLRLVGFVNAEWYTILKLWAWPLGISVALGLLALIAVAICNVVIEYQVYKARKTRSK